MRTTRPYLMGFKVSAEEREAIRKAALKLRSSDSHLMRLACLGVAEQLGVKIRQDPKDGDDERRG